MRVTTNWLSIFYDKGYVFNRYTTEREYEWLASFSDLQPMLTAAVAAVCANGSSSGGARILQLGCGNSRLAADLHAAGFTNVTNIDLSEVCVANMRRQYPGLSFLQMDMTSLTFPDASFDVVLEKASLDALLVDAESPWNLDSPGHRLVTKTLREVKRVLRPSGVFLSVTFSQPHHRVCLLAQQGLDWSVKVDKLTCSGSVLDYYVMRMEACEGRGPEEALAKFGVSQGPHLQYHQDYVSEDEESFLNNVCIESSDGSSGGEEQPSSG